MMPGDKRGLNNESVLRIKSAFEVAVLFMAILAINCVMEVVLDYRKTSFKYMGNWRNWQTQGT